MERLSLLAQDSRPVEEKRAEVLQVGAQVAWVGGCWWRVGGWVLVDSVGEPITE